MDKIKSTIAHKSVPDVTFRTFQGEADFALIRSLMLKSAEADGIIEAISLEDVCQWYAPSPRCNPAQDLFFAEVKGQDGSSAAAGFSRVSWYTGRDGLRLYSHTSYLLPEWRETCIWPLMIRQNEGRLRQIAAGQTDVPARAFQAWVTENETQKIAVLEAENYQAVRHFNNMLNKLDDIPQMDLPPGFELRPVQPEHMRRIWEVQKEINQGLFEYFAEHWGEETYPDWRDDPSHTPQLWLVAWDGDELAGMVLNRIDEAENLALQRKHGYTEHVFVRASWRKRGLAGALVSRSLQLLKAQGMQETELGVDSENDSGAYRLYQKLGFRTYSTDIWFRKPMDD